MKLKVYPLRKAGGGEDLPPGKYTLTAWQERYGAKTAQVTVDADKPTEVSFAYDAK